MLRTGMMTETCGSWPQSARMKAAKRSDGGVESVPISKCISGQAAGQQHAFRPDLSALRRNRNVVDGANAR